VRHHPVKINNDTIQQNSELQHVAVANGGVTPTETVTDQFSTRPKGTASPSRTARYQTPKRDHVAFEDVINNDSIIGVDPPLQKEINKRQDVRAIISSLLNNCLYLVWVDGLPDSIFQAPGDHVQRCVLPCINLIKTIVKTQDSSNDDPTSHGIGVCREVGCDSCAADSLTRNLRFKGTLGHPDGIIPDPFMIPVEWMVDTRTPRMDIVMTGTGWLACQHNFQIKIIMSVFKVGMTTNVALRMVVGHAVGVPEISEKSHGDDEKDSC